MTNYDCTTDVYKHKSKVTYWLEDAAHILIGRAKQHDISKLQDPEKAMFDVYTPKLKELKFGSDEYKQSLLEMGEALKHHYAVNRHHPEHYENGVNGMSLYDLVEMFCDWLAAAEANGKSLDMNYLSNRFNLSPQLVDILINTMNDVDFWNEVNGVPVTYFSPEDRRNQYKVML
jgi:hypothetical protein